MREGHYVRCPIILEENDKYYPRCFVLGKITKINTLSDEIRVQFYDLKKSRVFFPHVFARETFPRESVDRCGASKYAPVNTPSGPGILISRRLETKPESFYEYYVMLESGITKSFMEDQIEIECTCVDYQPLRQMLNYEFQNPTWYANRLQVSSNMHMVNNTVYGFKELVGCRTFLMAHQISTVVRTFESRPIRYMLADEVGLGKTIEACSIIKILSTEKKGLRVLYIVPGALVQQWKNELYYKFQIDATINYNEIYGINNVIVALEDLEDHSRIFNYKWDVLIVDETHRLLNDENKYKLVLQLSRTIDNALLLSATPIQSRREEYLRLLSLLQPEQYCKMDLPTFSSILSKQKKIQRRVNGIIAHMPQFTDYKEDSLEKLFDLSEELEDTNLSSIIRSIDLESPDSGQYEMEQALSYISENYRIERNIIRNRREYVGEVLGERILIELPYDMKSSDDNYSERNVYYSLLEFISRGFQDDTISISQVFAILQAMFSSPWALNSVLSSMEIDDSMENLIKLWTLQADEEIEQVNYLLDESPDMIKGRLLYAVDYIEQFVITTANNNGKVVVFSEYPETLWKFGELLDKRRIKCVCFTSNMLREELEDSVYEFQNTPSCRVILCDSTGGEGRNFQNADWLIHLDLPWTANAIEQRIGRLDRLGRDSDHLKVNSVVLYSKETIETQLFEIWNRGLDLFKKSLSGLEIITGDLNQTIEDALYDDVYNGLENALEDIIDMTEETRDAVEEEQLYDSGSVIYRPLTLAVRQMLKTYGGGENELFQSSMLGWANQAGLSSKMSKDHIVQFSQAMFSPRAAIQSLFVPPFWSFYNNSSIVRKQGVILGTFNRHMAIQREDLLFYAPGDPVFDSIIGNALDNGRGRCCAFSAKADFDYKGFVFIYNVEPTIRHLIQLNIPIQLLSQFRMYLPMKQIVVPVPFVGYEKITTRQLTEFMFNKQNIIRSNHLGQRSSQNDSISPLELFIQQHPQTEWHALVNRASKVSKEKAREMVNGLSALEDAKKEIDRIVSGYESEYLYLGKDMEKVKEIRNKYDAIYYALSHPLLRTDSIGLLYLTRR